ncbi:hypothetical protein PTTG_07316 [Puccinia triticina 1-1 BBBD Race 1]|uniref:MICOS complex subunit MIC60 n=1 Tax=Puccinia triticina (isolate 1-1 / race 1 (BBBD)) TaxID=630390 RepID=A0A180GYF8_PUCT1|nr:hypothetical protein PTTG_07316 [Puccinia triticina 1-1 BBBD Race 1]
MLRLSRRLRTTHRLNYATAAAQPPKKKGLIRTLVLPTTLLGGAIYGAGIYASFQNDKFRDFFMDQVPLGETLLNLCEESNLEQLADLSKRTIHLADQSITKIKAATGITTTDQPPVAEKITPKTEAAVQPANQNLPTPSPVPPKTTTTTTTTTASIPISDQVPIAPGLPTYNREIPIGHEPPPGYLGAAPRPRDPSTEPLPPPPALPLLAPTVKKLSSSEPILGQLASSIDSLAGFLRDHPDVLVRGKDPSGKDAPRVLSAASEDLKHLAGRLEAIKAEKQAQLQSQLEAQAREYGKILLDAERELHQRLDQQEESWKQTFDQERATLAKAFEAKLAMELESQQALINERLEHEVIAQGLEMQRRWMREIKSQVELEREGRWGKLAELEGCMKQLGRLTLDNEDYLEDHLRINQLWNAVRAISAAAFENHAKVPLDHEARALQRICQRAAKTATATAAADNDDQKTPPDVIAVALESMPAQAIDAGVESLAGLTLWFKSSVFPRIQSASLLPVQGGLLSYITSHILSRLFFTHLVPDHSSPTSQDPISVLTQVNSLLDRKDLDQAARLLNSLDGWPKVLARDWLQAARRHLELHQAIQVIEAEATLQSLLL